MRTVFNDTFWSEWEFHRMTSAEFHEFVDQIKLVDPQQFLLAEVDGQTAGFCFGFPDWTPLFQSFNGKVGPLQLVRPLLRGALYYPVNNHNLASRRLAKSFGATGRILYTAYDKPLV